MSTLNMCASPVHEPVLLDEVIDALQIQRGGRYVDCTVNGGGHAEAILDECIPGGKLLGIDADPEAIKVATERLKSYGKDAILVNENFKYLENICTRYGFHPVNGILFDLGMSTLQLESSGRGFSFQQDAPLDMRFSPRQAVTAADIVNTYSEGELTALLEKYGEEWRGRQIARRIVEKRPIATTVELAQIVSKAVAGGRGKIHPATKTFQALRIAVNQELENLELALKQAVNLLGSGGRIIAISFHSLEDRLVKEFFRRESQGCLCPPAVPICVCGHISTLRLVTKKTVRPSLAELETNPRSRSAKMRVAERI
ncbi:MAG TPA: 16S rRNA (cytosine(1402)-N(4))-methyltransferase RsmH [Dehalococcoidia bacterium]|nr:16S rRNA (cytosine(1402)-N(4))-methyltransferase RsmH [Dehalococcoidia bacterium]